MTDSALKTKSGAMCLPTDPAKFLEMLGHHCTHAVQQSDDLVDSLEEMHDAICFWLQDKAVRELPQQQQDDVKRGLH